jgi:hypothetical protein
MAHIPFAFSVSHFINSVGADAGFASIIGLAILVLLYFAQARETSTLRNRADDAEQRAGALESRLAQVSRAQSPQTQPVVAQRPAAARPLVNPVPGVQVAPAGSPAVAGATASAVAATALPGAPAGVGAPALTSATRLIPLPAVAAEGAVGAGAALAAAEEAPATSVAASAAPVASVVAASPQAPPGGAPPNGPQPDVPQAPVGADVPQAPVGAPRPATVAAQAAASPSPSATAIFAGDNGPHPPGAPGAGTNGAADHDDDEYSDEFAALATQEPEPLPRVQLRPGGPGPVRPAQPAVHRYGSPRGSSPVRRGFVVLLGVLGVAAVAAVLLIVTSSGGNTSASSSSTATTNTPAAHHRAKAKAAFAPSTVSIGVLNGTAQAGLAATVMTRLTGVGYKQGITPANAANQTQTTTVVAYLPGQRAAAVHVASALKLSTSAVQPIDSQTQQIACPQASSCAVNVVVTVGQDLAGG